MGHDDRRGQEKASGIYQMILKALTLGFSTGVFCLGYCYPILAPIMLSREQPKTGDRLKNNVRAVALFLLGRLIAYIAFGAVIGALGHRLKTNQAVQVFIIPALFLLLGLLMVAYGVLQNFPRWQLCRMASRYFQNARFLFLMGLLAGLNLCPPFLLAMSYVLSLGEIVQGVVFFLFFFLSTSVFLIPFLFSGVLSRFHNVRVAARLTAVIAGGWFIYLGLGKIIG
jgi:sulfite exporter TauE/SafE